MLIWTPEFGQDSDAAKGRHVAAPARFRQYIPVRISRRKPGWVK